MGGHFTPACLFNKQTYKHKTRPPAHTHTFTTEHRNPVKLHNSPSAAQNVPPLMYKIVHKVLYLKSICMRQFLYSCMGAVSASMPYTAVQSYTFSTVLSHNELVGSSPTAVPMCFVHLPLTQKLLVKFCSVWTSISQTRSNGPQGVHILVALAPHSWFTADSKLDD